ncbi:MAG: hypothetical protein UT61_C0055G0003 [Candidatus Woesebacteria bacterium GW2011_GWA1_39_8]|uniref:Uncharacterized protein n=1 Tax=Candidatus Woesebacteria bacterium GW2011_GWA1_39_8 TaxID=1618552 RepID=A0A0G0PJX1_9BACT|nr:MAG: hypothetical protein UT61_C0055G0003 [Candidatus Woesebacteria bacterium GW2011_GWA1_39_8]
MFGFTGIFGIIAGYVGAVILIISLFVYLFAIKKGKVTSNRVTWGVWILVNALFCASYYESVGLVSSIWVPLVYLISTIIIFLFLLAYGASGEWTWVEKVCLVGVGVILMLWIIFRAPLTTLTLTMMIDILGAIPLIVAVWKNPEIDYGPAWYFGFGANAINLLAIEHWDYANASYPLYLTILTLTVSVLIRFPRFLRTQKTSVFVKT